MRHHAGGRLTPLDKGMAGPGPRSRRPLPDDTPTRYRWIRRSGALCHRCPLLDRRQHACASTLHRSGNPCSQPRPLPPGTGRGRSGDAPGFPGNIFGEVVSWSGDLSGEITLNVEGKFVPIPGGHPTPAAFTVKIQQFGGAGVGHWTLESDGVVFCIETLKSGQIVLRRL